MRLFEYQAKGIFQKYGIPIPKSQVISNAALADQVRDEIGKEVVLKAQVLIHGRSKAGGIKLVHPYENVGDAASEILSLSIGNKKVKKILIEEAVQVQKEFFLKLEIDPYLEKPVFVASKFDIKKSLLNGMEASENRIRVPIEFSTGPLDYQLRKLALTVEIGKDLWKDFSQILSSMWRIFRDLDADLIEINPLIINERNQLVALGGVVNIDDQSLFRQAAVLEMKESEEKRQLTVKAEKFGISVLQSEGNVSCIVNDEALGCAIRDMLLSQGVRIGIQMNLGDGAGDEKISAGLDLLFKNGKTDCILIAIIGGQTHCDNVAAGIIESIAHATKIPQMIIYLNGMNSDVGKSLLNHANILFEDSLNNAVRKCSDLMNMDIQ